MNLNAILIKCCCIALLLAPMGVKAQESVATQDYRYTASDAKFNQLKNLVEGVMTSVMASVTAIQSDLDTTKEKLGKMETCNDKSMLYAPNDASADASGCLEPQADFDVEGFVINPNSTVNKSVPTSTIPGSGRWRCFVNGEWKGSNNQNSVYNMCKGVPVYYVYSGNTAINANLNLNATQQFNKYTFNHCSGCSSTSAHGKYFKCPSNYEFFSCGGSAFPVGKEGCKVTYISSQSEGGHQNNFYTGAPPMIYCKKK